MLLLTTTRLTIRELSVADAPFILELLNEPGFLKYIGDRGVRNVQHAQDYIVNGPIASYNEHGFGLNWVGLRDGNVPIGICGLLQRDYLDDPDIGFAFLAQYGGQGYAFEAAQAVMDDARDRLGISRIVAITSIDNQRSANLLEKIGLQFQENIVVPGEQKESRFFSTP